MKSFNYSNTSYQVGGCLSGDALSYVWREADNQLYQSLIKGEFCYVLNSRQMGKSSLRVKTMKRLEENGAACTTIHINTIVTQDITLEQWYLSLIESLVDGFNLEKQFELHSWWEGHKTLSYVHCFGEFIEKVLLVKITQPVFIFLDEIDSTLRLKFKDDFFALIRDFHNKKAENNSACKRLSFILLGVASPCDLIQDKNRTPFNIGQAIKLQGFTLDEVKPLEEGLKDKVDNTQAVLKEILYWTGGQPFLTQKICQLIQNSDKKIAANQEEKSIEKLVETNIIDNWEEQDEPQHLRTIRDRIKKDKKYTGKLLGIYQKILKNEEVNADDSLEVMQLQLSGLVVKQGNKLKTYNPIYKTVFDEIWVNNELDSIRPDYYAEKLLAWLNSNQLDDNQLLNKEELYNAQKWASNKSLSGQDYKFLTASLDLQRRKAEEEAKETLANASKKAKVRFLFGTTFLIGILIFLLPAFLVIQQLRSQKEAELQKRISIGEDILLNPNLDKRAGAKLFSEGDFEQATLKFRKSLDNNPNDPEALIYWNNAKFANSNPISIAVGIPIGKNEYVAQEMLRGVAQAINDANKNCENKETIKDCGINGRPLQVKIVNDDNDPEIAQELATLLVKDKDVLAVVGHNASDVSRSAANEYQGNLVMISPTSFSMDFHNIKKSKVNYVFRNVPGIRDIVYNLAQHIDEEVTNPKILICYDSDADDNRSFKEEFSTSETEIEIVNLECDFRDPTLNHEQIIKQAKNQGANSLLLAPHVDRINEAIELAKINYKQKSDERLQLFSSPSLYTSITLEDEVGRVAVEGMQLAVAWHPKTNKNINHSFYSNARALWEKDLDYTVTTWRTAMSYDATQVIIKGLRQEPEPTRKSLQKSLSNENFFFDGVTGIVEFKEGERDKKEAFLVEIKQVEDSEIDFDFVPIPDIERQ